MRVFNYTDKPVMIKNVPIDQTEIYIPSHIQRWNVKHNGSDFIPPASDDRNIILTITSTGQPDSYKYKTESFSIPDVFMWVSIFITFFGFYFIIRVVQKIKMS